MHGYAKVIPEECLNRHDYQTKNYEHESPIANPLEDTMFDNQDIPNLISNIQDRFNEQSNEPSSVSPLNSFDHIPGFRKAKPLLIQPKYSAQSLEEQFQIIKVMST